MIVLYHNPESEDSKQCLEILETSKHNHEVIKHQEKPLDEHKLFKIVSLLNIKPSELIRKDEKIWKERFQHLIDAGHRFTDEEYIKIMIEYQELIERPIIINGEKAVIGKPPKRIFDILS